MKWNIRELEMTREYKTVSAIVTAIEQKEDTPLGIVDHLISVYGVIDGGQDMAHKGMFTKTIKERKDDIVVADNHNHNSVLDVLGMPLEFYEVGRHDLPPEVLKKYPEATGGQCAKTQFLLDTPEGLGAFTRLKAGAIKKFSFAYDAIQKDYEQIGDIKVRHLREVKLYEYGPVIFPMNEAAAMIAAKAENEEPVSEEKQKLLAWLEEKEIGYGRKYGKVREAFYNSYAEWDGEWFSIMDVYEKYLLVESNATPVIYQVPYQQETETSVYTFAAKGDWLVGELEFIPKVADSAAKSTEELELEALLDKEEAEIKARFEELGFNSEAGPDLPPSTSETEEADWELEHQKISEALKNWRV